MCAYGQFATGQHPYDTNRAQATPLSRACSDCIAGVAMAAGADDDTGPAVPWCIIALAGAAIAAVKGTEGDRFATGQA